MTNSRLALLGSSLLLLAACGAPANSTDLTELLKNPLYAEQYYDAQTDHMVDLLISSGALLDDPSIKAAIEKARTEGIELARAATSRQAGGKIGTVLSDSEEAMGEVLLLDNTVYVGPDFMVKPGVDIHAYLSEALDPREITFPDETAIDIGAVRSALGAAVYPVSLSADQTEKVRLFVLYDRTLKYVVGFAQLSEQ